MQSNFLTALALFLASTTVVSGLSHSAQTPIQDDEYRTISIAEYKQAVADRYGDINPSDLEGDEKKAFISGITPMFTCCFSPCHTSRFGIKKRSTIPPPPPKAPSPSTHDENYRKLTIPEWSQNVQETITNINALSDLDPSEKKAFIGNHLIRLTTCCFAPCDTGRYNSGIKKRSNEDLHQYSVQEWRTAVAKKHGHVPKLSELDDEDKQAIIGCCTPPGCGRLNFPFMLGGGGFGSGKRSVVDQAKLSAPVFDSNETQTAEEGEYKQASIKEWQQAVERKHGKMPSVEEMDGEDKKAFITCCFAPCNRNSFPGLFGGK